MYYHNSLHAAFIPSSCIQFASFLLILVPVLHQYHATSSMLIRVCVRNSHMEDVVATKTTLNL